MSMRILVLIVFAPSQLQAASCTLAILPGALGQPFLQHCHGPCLWDNLRILRGRGLRQHVDSIEGYLDILQGKYVREIVT